VIHSPWISDGDGGVKGLELVAGQEGVGLGERVAVTPHPRHWDAFGAITLPFIGPTKM